MHGNMYGKFFVVAIILFFLHLSLFFQSLEAGTSAILKNKEFSEKKQSKDNFVKNTIEGIGDDKLSSAYYIVRNSAEVKNPYSIPEYKVDKYKGNFFTLRTYSKIYYFQTLALLNEWLIKYKYPPMDLGSALFGNPILQTALKLMIAHQSKVFTILGQGINKNIIYREIERYTNSFSNYFFRENWNKFRLYTGYVIDGVGKNACNGNVDTTWGLDCSGFTNLVYKMNSLCFPRMKSDDMWPLYDNGVADPFNPGTINSFFTITNSPLPGDLVLQDGHIGIYISNGLSFGMNEHGISVEYYKNRPESATKPLFVYLRFKQKPTTYPPACVVDQACNYCEEYDPVKYFNPSYQLDVDKEIYRIKYKQPLYYTLVDNGNGGSTAIAKDQYNYGSGVNLCLAKEQQ
ncbi:MAG: C40 family peptidase [Oligoflexia bacterium]|nr:C40 family peptidase [Oligoflexia bacterium]